MSHPEEAERPRLSQVGRKERRAQRLKNIRLRERAKIPGDIGPGVAAAPAAPAPVPAAPLVAAPQPSAWWMDPKILLLGAASPFHSAPEKVLMAWWSDWGGTPHLENLSSADQMYRDRLTRWSQTSAFPHWGAGDLRTALDAIPGWYQPSRVGYGDLATTAAEYWGNVSSWWISPEALYLTISDAQRAKIVAVFNQSAAAAEEYETQRDPVTHLPTKGDLWSQVPWWAYGVAGLVVWNTIRK